MFKNISITTVLISYLVLLFSLCVHEMSHALSAHLLGDDTAKRMGRLTLNPIAHMDPIGTLIFPLLGMSTGLPLIGWAKPVPVNPANFTRKIRMRMGDVIVSAAGPGSNLILAILALPIVALMVRIWTPGFPDGRIEYLFMALQGQHAALQTSGLGAGQVLAMVFVGKLVFVNLALALFNLLPFGPLDGAWILRGFLPDRLVPVFDHYRPAMGIILILVVMLTNLMSFILGPVLIGIFMLMLPIARLIIGA